VMSGVKVYRQQLLGSAMNVPMAAVTFRPEQIMSTQWCHRRCHAPNRFGTVNMEDNINIK